MSETKVRRGRPPKDATKASAPEATAGDAIVPEAASASKDIPPCPELDPVAGDKSQEIIAWWFTHHPEEAAKRYSGRKGHNLTPYIQENHE